MREATVFGFGARPRKDAAHETGGKGLRDNKPLLAALRDLHTDATRVQLWFSVPNQAVAELREPGAGRTFWDFRYMDPVVIDFFANTSGRRHVNIGTIPRWMFNVPPVDLPGDPAASFYGYTRGTAGGLLKDPTGRQFGEYQARLFQWYTEGGFTDEVGKWHESLQYWASTEVSASSSWSRVAKMRLQIASLTMSQSFSTGLSSGL